MSEEGSEACVTTYKINIESMCQQPDQSVSNSEGWLYPGLRKPDIIESTIQIHVEKPTRKMCRAAYHYLAACGQTQSTVAGQQVSKGNQQSTAVSRQDVAKCSEQSHDRMTVPRQQFSGSSKQSHSLTTVSKQQVGKSNRQLSGQVMFARHQVSRSEEDRGQVYSDAEVKESSRSCEVIHSGTAARQSVELECTESVAVNGDASNQVQAEKLVNNSQYKEMEEQGNAVLKQTDFGVSDVFYRPPTEVVTGESHDTRDKKGMDLNFMWAKDSQIKSQSAKKAVGMLQDIFYVHRPLQTNGNTGGESKNTTNGRLQHSAVRDRSIEKELTPRGIVRHIEDVKNTPTLGTTAELKGGSRLENQSGQVQESTQERIKRLMNQGSLSQHRLQSDISVKCRSEASISRHKPTVLKQSCDSSDVCEHPKEMNVTSSHTKPRNCYMQQTAELQEPQNQCQQKTDEKSDSKGSMVQKVDSKSKSERLTVPDDNHSLQSSVMHRAKTYKSVFGRTARRRLVLHNSPQYKQTGLESPLMNGNDIVNSKEKKPLFITENTKTVSHLNSLKTPENTIKSTTHSLKKLMLEKPELSSQTLYPLSGKTVGKDHYSKENSRTYRHREQEIAARDSKFEDKSNEICELIQQTLNEKQRTWKEQDSAEGLVHAKLQSYRPRQQVPEVQTPVKAQPFRPMSVNTLTRRLKQCKQLVEDPVTSKSHSVLNSVTADKSGMSQIHKECDSTESYWSMNEGKYGMWKQRTSGNSSHDDGNERLSGAGLEHTLNIVQTEYQGVNCPNLEMGKTEYNDIKHPYLDRVKPESELPEVAHVQVTSKSPRIMHGDNYRTENGNLPQKNSPFKFSHVSKHTDYNIDLYTAFRHPIGGSDLPINLSSSTFKGHSIATGQVNFKPVLIYDPLIFQHLCRLQHVYQLPFDKKQCPSFNGFLLQLVDLGVRGDTSYPYDVTVTRREMEGFGFVIISSVTRAGSVIGEYLKIKMVS